MSVGTCETRTELSGLLEPVLISYIPVTKAGSAGMAMTADEEQELADLLSEANDT